MDTAREFLRSKSLKGSNDTFTDEQIEGFLIEFSRGHCKAQSRAIEESAYIVTKRDKFRNITSCKINRESIVTAYPLDKIK